MLRNAGDEPVDVIDEEGRTIGTVTRREMRARRLPHRSVYIIVFDSHGNVFIHLRTATKDVYPSHWDVAVGGVVAAGESFEEGASREVQEELGVPMILKPLFPFRFADQLSVVHAMVYRGVHDGPFRLQAEEIVRGEFVAPAVLEQKMRTEKFCPDGLEVWRTVQGQYAY